MGSESSKFFNVNFYYFYTVFFIASKVSLIFRTFYWINNDINYVTFIKIISYYV